MSKYTARLSWQLDETADFTANRYSRRHLWQFDGGVVSRYFPEGATQEHHA